MKNPFKKEQITSQRTFSYSKTGVNLSFTLNIGNKEEMSKFKELLEKALLDVNEELESKELPRCSKGHIYNWVGGRFCEYTGFPGAGGGANVPLERKTT